ncbi:MAG: hypothetical protein JXR88_18390 [Clostridia bacterium]|nr:hypothetical protein [Clostridia bacterium]
MNLLDLSIILFVLLETSNVLILYFKPDSRKGNGVAVFNFWHDSKENENAHLFAQYMTNWVAGTKLIFIVLLLVILFTAGPTTKLMAVIVMVLSIGTYYFRLHKLLKPWIKKIKLHPVAILKH